MSWNRRMIRHLDGSLAVHEVYYDNDGKPTGWSQDATEAVDPGETIDDLRAAVQATYDQSMRALAEPILVLSANNQTFVEEDHDQAPD